MWLCLEEREGGGGGGGGGGRENALLISTQNHAYPPDRVEERGLLVDVIMAAGLGDPVAIPDTRAAELAVWRELELSSRAMASLFSFERRFWNHTWMTLMSSPVLLIRSSLICFDGFCSRLYAWRTWFDSLGTLHTHTHTRAHAHTHTHT